MGKQILRKKLNEDPIDNAYKGVEKEMENAGKEIKKEILFNVPNSITLLRLILTFVFVYMLFKDFSPLPLAIVFAFAAITDWFDGYFARKLKQTSKFGARLDQVVDRIFTIVIVFAIIAYLVSHNKYDSLFRFSSDNVYLMLFLISSREIIGTPGVFILLIRRKPTYNVRYVGKVTTFIQSVALCAIILNVWFAIYLAMATCIVGILAGFDYLKYSLS